MSKETVKQIDIAQEIAPIISSRDVIAVLKQSAQKANTSVLHFDFSSVEFISRSAAHELLLLKEELEQEKDISFIHIPENVRTMLRTVAASRAVPKEKEEQDIESVDAKELLYTQQ